MSETLIAGAKGAEGGGGDVADATRGKSGLGGIGGGGGGGAAGGGGGGDGGGGGAGSGGAGGNDAAAGGGGGSGGGQGGTSGSGGRRAGGKSSSSSKSTSSSLKPALANVPNTHLQKKIAGKVADGKRALYYKHASGRELAGDTSVPFFRLCSLSLDTSTLRHFRRRRLLHLMRRRRTRGSHATLGRCFFTKKWMKQTS